LNNKIKISGIQKTSLIDYPDYISTVLFTQGCNMNCPYCHNPELIVKENNNEYLKLPYFWEYLEKRADLIDGVVITGGEPLIHSSLYDFIKNIKEHDLLVKLDTNGTNYELLKRIIGDDLIDYVAMDIKGPIEDYGNFCGIKLNNVTKESIKKSRDLILNTNIDYELRTTIVPDMHTKDVLRKIAAQIMGCTNYYLQNFRSGKVNDPEYTEKRSFSESEIKTFIKIFEDYNIEAKIRV